MQDYTNHPVAIAVAPMKADAMEYAAIQATHRIDAAKTDMAAHGMDRNLAAPYPMRVSGIAYHTAMAKHRFYSQVFKSTKSSLSHGEPDIAEFSQKGADNYIAQRKLDIAASYDAFVAKLIGKIGACDTATCKGNHVWGESFLTVTKGDQVETWKTQQICNVSKLGLPFNQWPSRKMKGAK